MGPTKAKMRKKGLTKTKNDGTGTYKGQNEGNRPAKNFCLVKIQKVPRAYESLNPALGESVIFDLPQGHYFCRNFDFR